MIRAIILLFITILGIFFLISIFAFDFFTSVIPGWHTTILAPRQIMWLPLCFWGAFVVTCYIITAAKKNPIPRNSTIVYLLLSLAYPLLLSYLNFIASQGYEFDLFIVPKYLFPSLFLFAIGQLFFLLILTKNRRKKLM